MNIMANEVAGQPPSKRGIQRQIKLPLRQAFKISVRNITIRLGRAAITAAGTFLSIAFLMVVCTQAVAMGAMAMSQNPEQVRAPVAWSLQTVLFPAIRALSLNPDATTRARSLWLVIMSLLVCTVGITNSMLMSVTERFREIGTMKCLGALDRFVVNLLLIESMLMGFFGSLFGAILGLVVMVGWYRLQVGTKMFAYFDWATLFACLLFSVAVGTILSVVAAILPASRAAKLPPAAALRTEI
jgi:hypothetical protein